jgi:GT2 family glycosyltransferase
MSTRRDGARLQGLPLLLHPGLEGKTMIGVVIVVYNSADVILDCVESLLRQAGHTFRIVLVDNASPDDSVARLEAWAAGALPYKPPGNSPLGSVSPVAKPVAIETREAGGTAPLAAPVTILRSQRNLGYAGAVNLGLAPLAANPGVELLWVLNPDCVVPAGTIEAYLAAQAASEPFAIMGGRMVYHDTPGHIHADGGRVNPFSGICVSVNRGAPVDTTPLPSPNEIDYIIGANMVVSRAFLAAVGPMREDYFLYYEEVDWALRRGDLPLALAEGAVVYHHGGTSIGTGRMGERPSAFSNYFQYRNLMRFMRRFHPWRLPIAFAVNLARITRNAFRDDAERSAGALRGLLGLAPPPAVASRVGAEAAPRAFGRLGEHAGSGFAKH